MTKEEFKAHRESLGLTQAEFAKYLGLSREKTISEYENGKTPIPAWVAGRFDDVEEFNRIHDNIFRLTQRLHARDNPGCNNPLSEEEKEMLDLLEKAEALISLSPLCNAYNI
jgi:transcriptional regulator with XRE-family HTH domain